MELKKEKWTQEDIILFEEYLLSFSKGPANGEREQHIINTKLKCIAVPSQVVRKLILEIKQGNYEDFLKIWPCTYWTEHAIIGGLISGIKDFNQMEFWLNKYADSCDNWASCDTLRFNVNKKNRENFFKLAKRYLKSEKAFVRRVGIRILFKYIDEDYIDELFSLIDHFHNEEAYYVNMALAWLLCECFIKQRDKTLQYLENNKLNIFVLNKGIQKCRESFRVSDKDKELLLRYKANL